WMGCDAHSARTDSDRARIRGGSSEMTNMKVTGEETLTSAHELVAYVDRWAGYVAARVRPSDVDDVLQTVRETVLSRAADYDPALGEPGAWVFGIIRVTVRAARRGEAVEYARTGGR